MNAAHQMAEQARRNGGTIGADKTLEETKRVIQQEQYHAGNPAHSVPVPLPTYSRAQVSYNYNNRATGTVSSPVSVATNKQAGQILQASTTKTLTVSDFAKKYSNVVPSTQSNDFEEARQNSDGSVVITTGEDKGTLVLPPTHPNVSVQNAIVEDDKVKFLLGKVKHDDTTKYETSAQQARERGATLGANDDTPLTSAIKNYLQNDPLVAKAIETHNVNDLNKAMWKVRNDYTYANNTNDSTGREAAKQIEQLMRDLGGNLSGNISLQQAHDVAFSTKTPDAGVAKEDSIGNTILDVLSGGPGIVKVGIGILKGLTEGASKKAVEKATGKVAEGMGKAVINDGKVSIDAIKANPSAFSGKSVDEVAQMLKDQGYDVTVQSSTKSRSGAQIIKINNPGDGKNITQVQVSPGGGRHGDSPYVKISTSDQGIIKIVDGAESVYRTDGKETATIIFTGRE